MSRLCNGRRRGSLVMGHYREGGVGSLLGKGLMSQAVVGLPGETASVELLEDWGARSGVGMCGPDGKLGPWGNVQGVK